MQNSMKHYKHFLLALEDFMNQYKYWCLLLDQLAVEVDEAIS